MAKEVISETENPSINQYLGENSLLTESFKKSLTESIQPDFADLKEKAENWGARLGEETKLSMKEQHELSQRLYNLFGRVGTNVEVEDGRAYDDLYWFERNDYYTDKVYFGAESVGGDFNRDIPIENFYGKTDDECKEIIKKDIFDEMKNPSSDFFVGPIDPSFRTVDEWNALAEKYEEQIDKGYLPNPHCCETLENVTSELFKDYHLNKHIEEYEDHEFAWVTGKNDDGYTLCCFLSGSNTTMFVTNSFDAEHMSQENLKKAVATELIKELDNYGAESGSVRVTNEFGNDDLRRKAIQEDKKFFKQAAEHMEKDLNLIGELTEEERDYLSLIDENFDSNDKYFCCSAWNEVTSQTSFKIGRYPFENEYALNTLADFIVKDETEKSREKGMQKLKEMNSDELVEVFDKCCPCNRYIGRMEEFNEWLETGIDAKLGVSPDRCDFLMKCVNDMIKENQNSAEKDSEISKSANTIAKAPKNTEAKLTEPPIKINKKTQRPITRQDLDLE